MDEIKPVEPVSPKLEKLSQAAGEIKRGRGRPRKDGGSATKPDLPKATINPLPQWNLDLSKKLIQSEGFAWAGLTGFGGFLYADADLDFLAPLGLEVFKELLPETQWTFIVAFFLGYAGIKGVQIRNWSSYKKELAAQSAVHKTETPVAPETPKENAT